MLLAPVPVFGDALPLSRPHAHLDTATKCTSCHVVLSGVPVSKCLACHQDIESRLRRRTGYHGRVAANLECIACHREHLGRNHEITPLDPRTFNHNDTGWPLEGGHVGVECRECHTAKRPGSNRDSYLGASTRCVDCHGEYHGRARSSRAKLDDCEQCHGAEDWKRLKPNLSFNHDRQTRFPRTGKHTGVECRECHLDPKRFGPIEVSGCVTCHQDPHPSGVFGRRICEECHVTDGFEKTNIFEHQTTGWPLRGEHRKNDCLDCHKWERWRPPNSDCSGCHEDVHRGQFRGQRCNRCHQEEGWDRLKFNHNRMSRFPLKGRHRRVDCARCHPNGHYKPIEPACRTCHLDDNPHGENFGQTPCGNCHDPSGWMNTRFDHSVTGFPLQGRHQEQPCFRCHPNGTETEDDTRQECAFCHTDVHDNQFDNAACDRCHASFEQWRIPFFDHTLSRFQLHGKHLEVECAGCHKDGHYRPIEPECANCHSNFHEGQFVQPCNNCHSPHGWTLVEFDHDTQSQFPLYGLHRELDCKKCHVANDYKGLPLDCAGCHVDEHQGAKGPQCDICHTTASWAANRAQDHDFGAFSLGGVHDRLPCEMCHGPDRDRQLAGTGPECVQCHRDPHIGSLGPFCYECHTQDYFLPSTFLHNQTGFRLSGAHRFVNCRDCHPNRIYGGLPTNCSFCHTDTFQQTAGTACDHTVQCPGGLDACWSCHTTSSFAPARPGVACGTCESSR